MDKTFYVYVIQSEVDKGILVLYLVI